MIQLQLKTPAVVPWPYYYYELLVLEMLRPTSIPRSTESTFWPSFTLSSNCSPTSTSIADDIVDY